MREKLYELLHCNVCESQGCITCNFCDDEDACISYMEHRMADHLIANGVEIVKHGRWVRTDDIEFTLGDFECSECEHLECDIDTMDLTPGENCLYYCPNCGARMDGDSDA